MPAESTSKRYSPASLVLALRVAPLSLLVMVTSAFLITAPVLSATLPWRLALAVTCPHKLTQFSSRQPMTMVHKYRFLFICSLLLVVALLKTLGYQTC